MKERLQFLNSIDVHDGRAADAQEFGRGKSFDQGGHRFAMQVRLSSNVQADVIVRRLDPVDVFCFQKNYPATRLYGQPVQVLLLRLDFSKQGAQTLTEFTRF